MKIDPRIGIAGVAAVVLLLGVAASTWLRSGPTGEPARPPGSAAPTDDPIASLADDIADLKAALDEERGLRGALELEVAILRQELRNEAAPPGFHKPAAAEKSAEASKAAPDKEREPDKAVAKGWFDGHSLRKQGVDEQHVAWLREQFEELQMEELYLRDEATREGWLGRPRYHNRVQALRRESRESLGTDDFGLMLWAAGRNNRVVITDVLQDSPAAEAGVESGDVVLRYGDASIVSPRDLTTATTRGKPGSTTEMDVLRNGSTVRTYLRRGPLGARIRAERRYPTPGL